LAAEFDRQIANLVTKGYPQAAGLSEPDFRALCDPLLEHLAGMELPDVDVAAGVLPFVVVVKSELVPVETALDKLNFHGRSGFEKLYPRVPSDFHPIVNLNIPDSTIYVITQIDRGRETLNVTPLDALKQIEAQGRSPLTIDEGIAILTQSPEFLMKNNCFSLLGSRCGDKRVPALWISEKRPKLGWCWEGNPHTWLGSASCGVRV